MSIINNWKTVLNEGNLPKGAKMDFISKWLICVRAEVFSMTITSVLIGVIIAFSDGEYNILYTVLILVALVLAHASNNLINDYFDYKLGTDTPDYERVQYAPHPIVSGLISEKTLLAVFFIFGMVELAIAVFFFFKVGVWALVFAVTGFMFSVFYVAPPLKLKYRGAGEFAIFLIWGPLITVGTYYVITGTMPLHAWLVSIPYGLVVMNVLLGKHLDKYEKDKEKNIRTMPVALGWNKAVAFTRINTAMFFITVAILVFLRAVTPLALLSFFAIGRFKTFMDILSSEKPKEKPEGFPDIWPLWYVVWAFWFNKMAGGLFIAGLMLGIIPWGMIADKIFGG